MVKRSFSKCGQSYFDWLQRKMSQNGRNGGTSDIKLLKPEEKGTIYFLVRRDKTLKAGANRCIIAVTQLKPNAASDPHQGLERPKRERRATRFLDAENTQKFQQSLKNAGEVEEKAGSD